MTLKRQWFRSRGHLTVEYVSLFIDRSLVLTSRQVEVSCLLVKALLSIELLRIERVLPSWKVFVAQSRAGDQCSSPSKSRLITPPVIRGCYMPFPLILFE
jgi:hypothetical protein